MIPRYLQREWNSFKNLKLYCRSEIQQTQFYCPPSNADNNPLCLLFPSVKKADLEFHTSGQTSNTVYEPWSPLLQPTLPLR